MHPNDFLVANAALNEQELAEVAELAHYCEIEDKARPLLYTNLLQEIRTEGSNLLYYEKKTLIGFLSVYFFYPTAAEICLMVLPSKRKKGIAKYLLKTIFPLLKSKGMEEAIFTIQTAHENLAERLGFYYKSSEYKMLRKSFEPILDARNLKIEKANESHIPRLSEIDKLCFNQAKDMTQRFTNLLKDTRYSLYVAYKGNELVGKAHIQWHEGYVSLSDIAIIPHYQGQGLGTELLAFCINECLKLGMEKIYLDVETRNQNALNLYTRQGFQIIEKYNYWAISLESLQTKI